MVQTPLPPPIRMKNHKSQGFLGHTGPDPLETHNTTNQAFNVGPSSAHQQRISFGLHWTDDGTFSVGF